MSHRLCDSAPSLLSLLHRASLCRHCLAAVTCHRPTAHCAQPPHLGVNRSIHWPCRHWQRVGVRVVRLSQRRLSDIQVAATLPSCGLVNWVCWVAPLRLGLQPGSLGAPIIAANAPLRRVTGVACRCDSVARRATGPSVPESCGGIRPDPTLAARTPPTESNAAVAPTAQWQLRHSLRGCRRGAAAASAAAAALRQQRPSERDGPAEPGSYSGG